MKPSPTSAFLLGLWLGGSVLLVFVVTYNFVGIEPSFEVNQTLAERAGFDPTDDNAKKTSVIWVYASELNRAFFSLWNRAQLGLGALTLVVLVVRCPRAGALIPVILAVGITAALTFYLAPELVTQGRTLDFIPRDPEPAQLAGFQTSHKLYSGLEVAKGILLLIAVAVVVRGAKPTEK